MFVCCANIFIVVAFIMVINITVVVVIILVVVVVVDFIFVCDSELNFVISILETNRIYIFMLLSKS
jgi:hypothetical protein